MSARPNVVYIMADDMGYGDLGCYGATKIPTPNIDKLAEQGMRFTDAHSSSAVCTPSRYSVMTGRYCWRTALKRGVGGGFMSPLIDPGRMTLASMLKSAGYNTAAVGKWHLGLDYQSYGYTDRGDPLDWKDDGKWDFTKPILSGPRSLGFDYFFGISGSLDMPPYCFIENEHTVGIPDQWKEDLQAQQRPGRQVPDWDDYKVDTTFAEKAVGWLNQVADDDKPFFLYLTPSAPHRPCLPPEAFAGASQAGPRGDMVCMVDWMVGQVMDVLERTGQADNTLIMLTSDNGARPYDIDGETHGHKSCGDLRGFKADIWDGGHREPLVVRWPGKIQPGSTCDQMVCLMDVMASLAEILEIDLPDNAAEDSFSFAPILLEQSDAPAPRDHLVHHSVGGMYSFRQGPWKMILGLGSGGFSEPRFGRPVAGGPEGQLYHMHDDTAETTNLWQEKPEIVKDLQDRLRQVIEAGRTRPLESKPRTF
ncbi:MAG: sulfatase family protein [Phycisphaerae bacterium]